MANETVLDHVIDVARHGGTEILSEPIPAPKVGGNFALDQHVVKGRDSLASLASLWHILPECVGFRRD